MLWLHSVALCCGYMVSPLTIPFLRENSCDTFLSAVYLQFFLHLSRPFNITCLYFFKYFYFALPYFVIDINLFYFMSILYRQKLRTPLGTCRSRLVDSVNWFFRNIIGEGEHDLRFWLAQDKNECLCCFYGDSETWSSRKLTWFFRLGEELYASQGLCCTCLCLRHLPLFIPLSIHPYKTSHKRTTVICYVLNPFLAVLGRVCKIVKSYCYLLYIEPCIILIVVE